MIDNLENAFSKINLKEINQINVVSKKIRNNLKMLTLKIITETIDFQHDFQKLNEINDFILNQFKKLS